MAEVRDYTALLNGGHSLNGKQGVGGFVSFSFPDTIPTYNAAMMSDAHQASFRPFSEAEKAVARAAIAQFEAVSGLTFFEVPDHGDLQFMNFSRDYVQANGQAYYPDRGGPGGLSSNIEMAEGYGTNLHVLLHEVGHALGLSHPFGNTNANLAPDLDHWGMTVMSYTRGSSPGTELAPLDIEALQYLYGTAKDAHVANWSWNAATSTLTQSGTADADEIFGMGGNNVINGGAGNDILVGRDGFNRFDGGDGDDELTGSAFASNHLFGGAGDDELWVLGYRDIPFDSQQFENRLDGGDGDDVLGIIAGTGTPDSDPAHANRLEGGNGNDILLGSRYTADALFGGAGEDYLNGWGVGDAFHGGDGDDSIWITGEDAWRFTVDGGAGIDRLHIDATASGARPDLDTLLEQGSSISGIEYLELRGPDSTYILGLETSERLTGHAGDDELHGRGGDDWIEGGAGNDVLNGGAGRDTAIFSGTYASAKFFTDGSDLIVITTGEGRDRLTGFEHVRFEEDDTSMSVAQVLTGAPAWLEPTRDTRSYSASYVLVAGSPSKVTIGGSGQVVGTYGIEIVTIVDLPSRIILDASFNFGGDRIYLAGDASSYGIWAMGSRVEVSDGDTTLSIPVGRYTELVFADGGRPLEVNRATGQALIGNQVITAEEAWITAADSPLVPLGELFISEAGRLIMLKAGEVHLEGNLDVIGTSGSETVHIPGEASFRFDGSFGLGGDLLMIDRDAGDVSASLHGSRVSLTADDMSLSIPVGTAGLTLNFADGERSLRYDPDAGLVFIGDQAISTIEAPLGSALLASDWALG